MVGVAVRYPVKYDRLAPKRRSKKSRLKAADLQDLNGDATLTGCIDQDVCTIVYFRLIDALRECDQPEQGSQLQEEWRGHSTHLIDEHTLPFSMNLV